MQVGQRARGSGDVLRDVLARCSTNVRNIFSGDTNLLVLRNIFLRVTRNIFLCNLIAILFRS